MSKIVRAVLRQKSPAPDDEKVTLASDERKRGVTSLIIRWLQNGELTGKEANGCVSALIDEVG